MNTRGCSKAENVVDEGTPSEIIAKRARIASPDDIMDYDELGTPYSLTD